MAMVYMLHDCTSPSCLGTLPTSQTLPILHHISNLVTNPRTRLKQNHKKCYLLMMMKGGLLYLKPCDNQRPRLQQNHKKCYLLMMMKGGLLNEINAGWVGRVGIPSELFNLILKIRYQALGVVILITSKAL